MVGEASDSSLSTPRPGMSDASVPHVAPRAPQALPALRVTILAIILGVAACAMAFTALRTASKVWYSVLYTFIAFLLLTAVLASRFRRGNERAFWFGFAVFGWAFFLLGHRPWMSAFGDLADPSGPPLNPNLLTSRVILFLLPDLRKPTNSLRGIDEITLITLGIAHLIMALIVGIAGGFFAVVLRKRSRESHLGQVARHPGGPGPGRLHRDVGLFCPAAGAVLPGLRFTMGGTRTTWPRWASPRSWPSRKATAMRPSTGCSGSPPSTIPSACASNARARAQTPRQGPRRQGRV